MSHHLVFNAMSILRTLMLYPLYVLRHSFISSALLAKAWFAFYITVRISDTTVPCTKNPPIN